MWTFERAKGKLIAPTGTEFTAYSGHGVGVNNPALESVHDVGPIPSGLWDIGTPFNDAQHGPYAMHLTPHSNTNTFGRDGFLCHGDSITHPGQASLGCVIAAHDVRVMIWTSGDHVLRVI